MTAVEADSEILNAKDRDRIVFADSYALPCRSRWREDSTRLRSAHLNAVSVENKECNS